jgi:membrane protein implicated in regulation of membrane protease activity
MCHLILLMPVLGIIVFWIWPLSIAVPVYTIILITSAITYFSLLKALHRPVTTGREGLIGKTGEIIDIQEDEIHAMLHGEIWSVKTNSALNIGDQVTVTGMNGLKLKVKKAGQDEDSVEIKSYCPV